MLVRQSSRLRWRQFLPPAHGHRGAATVQSGFRDLPCGIPQMLVEKQGAAMHIFPWDIGLPPEHYVPHSTVL